MHNEQKKHILAWMVWREKTLIWNKVRCIFFKLGENKNNSIPKYTNMTLCVNRQKLYVLLYLYNSTVLFLVFSQKEKQKIFRKILKCFQFVDKMIDFLNHTYALTSQWHTFSFLEWLFGCFIWLENQMYK